jgi:hypothetical protein
MGSSFGVATGVGWITGFVEASCAASAKLHSEIVKKYTLSFAILKQAIKMPARYQALYWGCRGGVVTMERRIRKTRARQTHD